MKLTDILIHIDIYITNRYKNTCTYIYTHKWSHRYKHLEIFKYLHTHTYIYLYTYVHTAIKKCNIQTSLYIQTYTPQIDTQVHANTYIMPTYIYTYT